MAGACSRLVLIYAVIMSKMLYNKCNFVRHVSLRNTVSASMRMKLASYCLALLLHMGDQTADLTLLHRDLGISDARSVIR